MILKPLTTMLSDPIEDHIACLDNKLAHGCSFKILKYRFGASQSVAIETFNQVIRVMV